MNEEKNKKTRELNNPNEKKTKNKLVINVLNVFTVVISKLTKFLQIT